MVHFFGILKPGFSRRAPASEAPYKADFFGGAGLQWGLTMSPAEADAEYLRGKAPAPAHEPDFDLDSDARFVRLCLPPC